MQDINKARESSENRIPQWESRHYDICLKILFAFCPFCDERPTFNNFSELDGLY
jgi:hypothetical protein